MTPAALRTLPPADLELGASALAGAILIALLVWLWRWDRRRRQRQARIQAITGCGFDHLRDVLVPDGQGGSLHVDFLLLTLRGVVIIDLRDVAGNIFGGDQMNEWTVMNGAQRYTFSNPQTALFDRIAAVRALAQELPVEGRIVFTGRGRFPKGLPRHTLSLESLSAEFPVSDRMAVGDLLDRWTPPWEMLKSAVAPSRLARSRAAI
ncbi:MAG TPA: nuclease-related domain-containing protein [Steroidobacteraceae bacterium]|nr:nuclease-related domain-containing protein [Steroidobacteraceae bacterium]